MIERKREIYIKLEKISKIIELLDSIREREKNLKILFSDYDKLNSIEDKIFENWNYYLEDFTQRLDHITL